MPINIARVKRSVDRAVVAAVLASCLAGCGVLDPAGGGTGPAGRYIDVNTCEAAPLPEDAGTIVLLDWDGGISGQVNVGELSGFDIDDLQVIGSATVSGDPAADFPDAVLARVREILCALDPLDVAVVRGEAEPLVKEEETMNVQRILDAAYRSAAEEREVEVEA